MNRLIGLGLGFIVGFVVGVVGTVVNEVLELEDKLKGGEKK